MANEQNLQQMMGKNRGLTTEQAVSMGRRGGIASGKARKKRRLMRESLEDLMRTSALPADIKARLEAAGVECDLQNAILLAMASKAMAGDVEAARFVRDTMGQRPSEALTLLLADKPIKAMELDALSDDDLAGLAEHAEAEEEEKVALRLPAGPADG